MRRTIVALSFVLALFVAPLVGIESAHAQGQVYTDTMDSAESGLLSTVTFDPTISFTYLNGQFVVNVQQPTYLGDITSTLNVPEMTDSRLTVDAAIGGDPNNKYVFAGCRHTDAGEGYSFGYLPATGDILIWRRDTTGDVNLAESFDASLINVGSGPTQIGIECIGDTISGLVNGQSVLSATDATYPLGRPTIGVGANGQETDGLIVAFDNLTVTDLGSSAVVPEPTVAPPVATSAEPAVPTSEQTAPITDPNLDPASTLAEAFTISLQLPPVVSGLGGDAQVDLDRVQTLPADVQLADFYAETYFLTPTLPESTGYLVGFCFWTEPSGNCYDLYLQDDGTGQATWGYGYDDLSGQYQSLQRGDMPPGSVDPTPGATNFLSITVYNGVAILSGNTFSVGAAVSLQGTPVAGDVMTEVGFVDTGGSTTTEPLSISTSDFAVWDLSSGVVPLATETATAAPEIPTAVAPPTTATESGTTDQPLTSSPAIPPVQGTDAVSVAFDQARNAALAFPPAAAGLSGSMTQNDNEYSYAPSGVTLADFYTIVTLTNPSDLATPSDVGIGFRADQGTESGLRFVVTSDGTWYLQQAGQAPYASGPATGFVTTPGASNVIELLVQGPTGIVVINGTALPALDLSPVSARGDVYVGTGFFQGDTLAGRVVPYSDWWLYPTDVLDVQSG